MNCTHCGCELNQANMLDYYELRLHYVADAKFELAQRKLDNLLSVDKFRVQSRHEPHEDILVGLFCGAKCLSHHVQAHIEPDATTET